MKRIEGETVGAGKGLKKRERVDEKY